MKNKSDRAPMGTVIGRTILREEIKRLVTERIVNGTYAPGARIVESQLAREFGTSQAPVREALRDLEGMNLIESEPHKGARVREQNRERLLQSYRVRAALEELAGREATPRISKDEIAALDVECQGMFQAAAQNDARAVMQHDTRFHQIVMEASGNEVLMDMWRSLRLESATFISALSTAWDLQMIAELHEPIFEAIKKGDADVAAKRMREHIEYFHALVLKDPRLVREEMTSPQPPA